MSDTVYLIVFFDSLLRWSKWLKQFFGDIVNIRSIFQYIVDYFISSGQWPEKTPTAVRINVHKKAPSQTIVEKKCV